jgi:Zn-dependent peptidase ImmA (M78 family)
MLGRAQRRHTSPRPGTGQAESRALLSQLRDLIPDGPLGRAELLRAIEAQAALLARQGLTESTVTRTLPSVRIEYADLDVLGLSFWDGRQWVVRICDREPAARQRFTLFHELAHIIWHPAYPQMLAALGSPDLVELAANYFAGLVLTPTAELRRYWHSGLRDPKLLASHFGVSARSIAIRQAQAGLRPNLPHLAYLNPTQLLRTAAGPNTDHQHNCDHPARMAA